MHVKDGLDFCSTSSEATNRSSQEKDSFTHLSADEDEMSQYLDGNGGDGTINKNMTSSLRGKLFMKLKVNILLILK